MNTHTRRPARALDAFSLPTALHIAPGWQDGVLRLATAVETLCDLTRLIRRQPMDSQAFRDLASDIIDGLIDIIDETDDMAISECEEEDEHLALCPARSDWRVV